MEKEAENEGSSENTEAEKEEPKEAKAKKVDTKSSKK